jgi:uncharacterized protein (TIGR01777 family)
MNVLVTGATGFVGRAVCSRLAADGHDIVIVSRNGPAAQARMPHARAAFSWDPSTGPTPAEAFEGVDAIVHLAGESVAGRWTEAKKRAIRESRVIGTTNLVDGLSRAGTRVSVLVSVSAIGYYGDRGDDVLRESEPVGRGFLAQVCRDWEAAAVAAGELGVRVVTPRLGIVLGRSGGALAAMIRPFRLGLGGPLASGRQWWSWIHLDDVAGLVAWCLQEPLSGALNATTPEPVRQAAFARALGRAVGRPAVLPAPAFALRALLGGFSSELLSSRRVHPARALEQGYRFRYTSIDQALLDLQG